MTRSWFTAAVGYARRENFDHAHVARYDAKEDWVPPAMFELMAERSRFNVEKGRVLRRIWTSE